jgi:flagellar basal-body rod protein FlgB
MFIEHLLNSGSAPALEATLQFTSARQRLLAENIVNVDTPGYRQKDLSLDEFQSMVRDELETRQKSGPMAADFTDIRQAVEHPQSGILFHDGNNRSMEQLMTAQAKNALMHNVAVELLRKQFETMEMALKGQVT